jgi:hypothetical protein
VIEIASFVGHIARRIALQVVDKVNVVWTRIEKMGKAVYALWTF